jgi:two-component system, NtrC family, nitrogen regulation response regulator NtrX
MRQILVVDDEVGIRELLSEILREEGYQVRLAENAQEARSARSHLRPDLVLLDIWMPDTDGITLLKEWASTGQLTMPVVMMSGHGTIDTAVEATRIGAYAFLEKPIALQKLLSTVGNALLKGESRSRPDIGLAILGRSSIVQRLRAQLEKARGLAVPILLVGEPGSGMDQCARSLHDPHTPWLELTEPRRLEERSANLDRQAAEGTVYLHEIDRLSKAQQYHLSNLLDDFVQSHTRFVSSSTVNLAHRVAQGEFDDRLYRQVSGAAIHVPTLRERADDIPELANFILSRAVEAREVPLRQLNTAALNLLRNYSWPGNLNQLEAVVKSVARLAESTEVGASDFHASLASSIPLPVLPLDADLHQAREAFERVYFDYQLARENGNMTRVAQKAGLDRTHLYRKLKQLGIQLPKRNED